MMRSGSDADSFYLAWCGACDQCARCLFLGSPKLELSTVVNDSQTRSRFEIYLRNWNCRLSFAKLEMDERDFFQSLLTNFENISPKPCAEVKASPISLQIENCVVRAAKASEKFFFKLAYFGKPPRLVVTYHVVDIGVVLDCTGEFRSHNEVNSCVGE